MKTIILNGSPRRNWNTAQLLQEAKKGAESVGAEAEYIHLYDLNFVGCRGCLACKRKGVTCCHCYWKDDLSPLLDKIFAADALIVGTPIYLGDTVSQFHAFLERLRFVMFSYDDHSNYFRGRVNVGIFFCMNVPRSVYESDYESRLARQVDMLRALNGMVEVLPCCDTLQVMDYSKYNMSYYNEEHKRDVHNNQFPVDLKKAFRIGVKLSRQS